MDKKEAKKKGLKGKDADRYVYGGLRATGWKPKQQKKKKGKKGQSPHKKGKGKGKCRKKA